MLHGYNCRIFCNDCLCVSEITICELLWPFLVVCKLWHLPFQSVVESGYMGVSENRGTPKWMIYNGKPHSNRWFGGTTIFGNTHIANQSNSCMNSLKFANRSRVFKMELMNIYDIFWFDLLVQYLVRWTNWIFVQNRGTVQCHHPLGMKIRSPGPSGKVRLCC